MSMNLNRRAGWLLGAGTALSMVLGTAFAAQPAQAPAAPSTAPAAATEAAVASPVAGGAAPKWVSETFGVEVHGARLSASGYVIDLRYRVLDADKARPLLDRKVTPVLVDETTGERFYVPQPPVVGALRQTSRNNAIALGKNYFMIFANPDQRIKAGQTLALYIGDQSFGNLRIDP
jgi:hypothetical protein